MFKYARRKVSLNKRRFQEDGFDLDLTYINPSIVAMGFPATGVESFYRNPRKEVQRLLEQKHKDHYKVYNLCIEKKWSYPPETFLQRVANFPFADHQAPRLHLMKDFCEDVEDWLTQDEDNMVAVHCKAGKGRAGMMICCWLIHSQDYPAAEEAMIQYANVRTKDGKGVTIPSQRRYVTYYEDIYNYGMPEQPTIRLKEIKIRTSAYAKPHLAKPYVVILSNDKEIFRSLQSVAQPGVDFILRLDNLKLNGDIKIEIYDESMKKNKPICHTWFNTAFIEDNRAVIKKPELDVAWKDKKCKKFRPNFQVELKFSGASVGSMAKLKAAGVKVEHKPLVAKKKSSEKKKKGATKSPQTARKSEEVKSKPKENGKVKKEEKKEKPKGKKEGKGAVIQKISSDEESSGSSEVEESKKKSSKKEGNGRKEAKAEKPSKKEDSSNKKKESAKKKENKGETSSKKKVEEKPSKKKEEEKKEKKKEDERKKEESDAASSSSSSESDGEGEEVITISRKKEPSSESEEDSSPVKKEEEEDSSASASSSEQESSDSQ